MEKYYIIYRIINVINKKCYIGKHETYSINDDYFGSGLLLKRSIAKYGIENFNKEILETCSSLEELNEKEKYWISILKSQNTSIGYNIMSGGDGGDNFTNHPDKEKIRKLNSIRNKGKIISEEQKKLISLKNSGEKNGMYGKNHTAEAKEKIRVSSVNRFHSNETKQKLSILKKGITFSDDHKKNLSKNHKGFTGMHLTDESKDKLRQAYFELPDIVCPICGRISKNKTNMARWHFENCKHKKDR